MSQRLAELLRQRAQLQEHLAWLDREIAQEQSVAPSGQPNAGYRPQALTTLTTQQNQRNEDPLSAQSGPPPLPLSVSQPSATGSALPFAEDILDRCRRDPGMIQQETRKGCLIAAAAVGILLLLSAVLAYALYAHHLGRWL